MTETMEVQPIGALARGRWTAPLNNVRTLLGANLAADLPDAQPDVAGENLVAILGGPHETKAVMETAVVAFRVFHDHALWKNTPCPLSGEWTKEWIPKSGR